DKTAKWNAPPAGSPSRPVQPPVAKTPRGPVKALAWLQCDPFPPIPVGHKPVVRLGRSRECDLVLPHESVSRVHAEVRALGNELSIEDRSTYGTTVNGERVRSSPLRPGDLVAIGPYMISVRPTREQRALDAATTKPFRLQSKSNEAMQGRLEKVSLAEVLQQIEFNEKTGTLRVFPDEDEGSGTLVVYEGRPVFAEFGTAKDVDAIDGMLALARGTYSFVTKVEAGEMSMEGKTLTGVLLELGRRRDEGALPDADSDPGASDED
ncbi:MAG: FHA domain-containing protein, partial [Planctomycetota bacterium]